MKNFAYIQGVNNNLTVVIEGKWYSVPTTHKNYALIEQLVNTSAINGEIDEVEFDKLYETKPKFTAEFGKRTQIVGDTIVFDGVAIHNKMADRIVRLHNEGHNVNHLILFLENLLQNPSYNTIDTAYTFLEHNSIPLTTDGHFIAYKYITDDYKDCYSRKFDNSVGKVVEMPRNMVDDNPNNTCSVGLHVGRPDYVGPGMRKSVVVKVNPRDIVCVPTDYNGGKMRVCRYEVLADYEKTYTDEILDETMSSPVDIDDD